MREPGEGNRRSTEMTDSESKQESVSEGGPTQSLSRRASQEGPVNTESVSEGSEKAGLTDACPLDSAALSHW